MSKVQQRPVARRSAAGPVSQSTGKYKGQSTEEVNALPEFIDDGRDVDLDPSLAGDGGFGAGDGTSAVIVSASFGKFTFPGRDDIPAQIRLFLEFQVAGRDVNRKEQLKYADYSKFAATKDGNTVKLRPSAVKKNKNGTEYLPSLFKYDQGVLFLQSLKDAGFSAEKLNKEGAKSIVGLSVHVRRQRVAGQGPDSKPALMVDYIDGTAAVDNTKNAAASAGAASGDNQKNTSNGGVVSALAETALLEILQNASGKSLSRAQIPAALIQIAQWKNHAERSAILKTLRDDAFIGSADAPWKFDSAANTVSLG